MGRDQERPPVLREQVAVYPSWIADLPQVDVRFPGAQATTVRSDDGQVVFWTFENGGSVPPHRHGPQLGIVLSGQVELRIEGELRVWTAGQMFDIGDQQEHEATVAAGTCVIEIFQEGDRHPVKSKLSGPEQDS
ncbi:cupin domain-containing protein [Streptosporangium sp. NPDC006007]|uniref:cupin domain-containing protein n=1 Tax=Streptosporangium sp. NPDC006007 TaxID=3154575 RepID=UPI0033A113B7